METTNELTMTADEFFLFVERIASETSQHDKINYPKLYILSKDSSITSIPIKEFAKFPDDTEYLYSTYIPEEMELQNGIAFAVVSENGTTKSSKQ